MREKIKDFIKDASYLSKDKLTSLDKFIEKAPPAVIEDIYNHLISYIELSESLFWENELKNDMENNKIPKYETAKGTRTPLQFLEDVWGTYIEKGVLYQDRLSSYDNKLIPAIYRYWDDHKIKPDGDKLPLPKSSRTEAIVQRVKKYCPDSFEEISRAIRAHEQRERRGYTR